MKIILWIICLRYLQLLTIGKIPVHTQEE